MKVLLLLAAFARASSAFTCGPGCVDTVPSGSFSGLTCGEAADAGYCVQSAAATTCPVSCEIGCSAPAHRYQYLGAGTGAVADTGTATPGAALDGTAHAAMAVAPDTVRFRTRTEPGACPHGVCDFVQLGAAAAGGGGQHNITTLGGPPSCPGFTFATWFHGGQFHGDRAVLFLSDGHDGQEGNHHVVLSVAPGGDVVLSVSRPCDTSGCESFIAPTVALGRGVWARLRVPGLLAGSPCGPDANAKAVPGAFCHLAATIAVDDTGTEAKGTATLYLDGETRDGWMAVWDAKDVPRAGDGWMFRQAYLGRADAFGWCCRRAGGHPRACPCAAGYLHGGMLADTPVTVPSPRFL